ncbi:ATP-binding protein [Streptomyces sp. NBC_01619]|uniref:ATP-binding protein n=1 Tax=Streptomyces sp. NBC_01619 TaxID=2975901 RepID=UPI00338EF5F6
MGAVDSTFIEIVSERVETWIEGGHESLLRARTACRRLAENAEWPPEAQEDLVLVVSELLMNAWTHSGPCRMSLEVSGDTAVVEIWDSDPHIPSPLSTSGAPASEDDSYGLGLVNTLSECLEFLPHQIGGKTARAIVVS